MKRRRTRAGDIAKLHAEDIDKTNRVISFQRTKTRWRELQPACFKYGRAVGALLEKLPQTGPLFPYLATVRSCDRATEFKQRCNGLGISGITLHSYGYAWAERAKSSGRLHAPRSWNSSCRGSRHSRST